jgi:hypothetical protein
MEHTPTTPTPETSIKNIPVMPTHETTWGSTIGIIIVIIILALGSFYFWGKEINKELESLPPVEETVAAVDILNRPDPTIEVLKTQGTSDAVQAIEQDLTATNLSSVDAELSNIDAELNK